MRKISLAVVYGLHTTDYSWLESFYPAQRLRCECNRRSIFLRFFFPSDVLTADDALLHSFDIWILRGEIPTAVYSFLAEHNILFQNQQQSVQLADDKFAMYDFLNGTPVALSERITDFTTLNHTEFPIVAKPRTGSQGRGVMLLQSMEDLKQFLVQSMTEPDDIHRWLFQKAETDSFGRDLRVLFCGDRIIGCFRRTSSVFLSNASQGSITEAVHLPVILEEWTKIIRQKTRLFFGCADFLYSNNNSGFVLCEVNASPGFASTEKHTGCNIAGALIDGAVMLID